MPSGLAAFIAGLGTGYMKQTNQNREDELKAAADRRTQEAHDATMAEIRKKLAGDNALQAAAQPQTVTAGAGGVTLPASADNRDVGQPDGPTVDNGQLQPGVRVGDQSFNDPAAAQAAATAANAPQAVRSRQIQALNGIDPERGARLEQETQATDAKRLELQANALKLGDAIWQHDSAAAKAAGFQGFEDLINRTEVGPMAGRKVKFVPSPDGSSTTLNMVNPDGSLKPTSLTFSNDAAGLDQAAIALDRAVTPMQRVEFGMKAGKNAAEVKELLAKAGYWDANSEKQSALAANGGSAKKADHFDEKQWDAAAKIDKDLVGIPDPMGGDKPTQSGDLRSQRMQLFNSFRTAGNLSPQEAAEQADTAVVNIKNIAMQRWTDAHAADKNSTMTIDQAIKQVIKEAAARAKAAQPAAGAAPGVKVNPAEQAARDTDRLGILQQEMKAAQSRLAASANADPDTQRRAKEDVDSLTREIARAQKNAGPRTGVATAAPAAPKAAGVVASTGVPATPAANARVTWPQVAALEQQLDAELQNVPDRRKGSTAQDFDQHLSRVQKLRQQLAAARLAASAQDSAPAIAQPRFIP